MKRMLVILLLCTPLLLNAQANDKVSVVTLGTFHFDYPNLDVHRIEKGDQIDVLEPKVQEEIEGIVDDLMKFRPTVIVVERQPGQQSKVDSLYHEYVKGRYQLHRSEVEQLGFRLAKRAGLRRLHCVDEWGVFSENISGIVYGTDTVGAARFESYAFNNPDSLKKTWARPTSRTVGLRNVLLAVNDERSVKESLGDYLVGAFKYEAVPGDFIGVDFETGRWFNRNLRIFRNIQRIGASPDDRIVVIFGSGHMNLLNYFFDCSPEYQRIEVKEYLK